MRRDALEKVEIPVEKVSKKELAEYRRLRKEMEDGKETPFEVVFAEIERERRKKDLKRKRPRF